MFFTSKIFYFMQTNEKSLKPAVLVKYVSLQTVKTHSFIHKPDEAEHIWKQRNDILCTVHLYLCLLKWNTSVKAKLSSENLWYQAHLHPERLTHDMHWHLMSEANLLHICHLIISLGPVRNMSSSFYILLYYCIMQSFFNNNALCYLTLQEMKAH